MPRKSLDCDVVIIGAGHNGLVCAAYLAAAGLSVHLIERRAVVGGAAVTEEFHPGFRNSVAAYAISLLPPKIIGDLELHRFGLNIVSRRVNNLWPMPDGRFLALGGAADMATEIGKFSGADAAAAPAYFQALERTADVVRDLVLQAPPNVGGGLGEVLKAFQLGNRFRRLEIADQRLLFDLFSQSAADFLRHWFEDERIIGALAFDSIVGTYSSPHMPGSAYILLHHAFGEVNGRKGVWGHALGGMGAVSAAMARCAQARGASITLNSAVREVLIENGRAAGVVLATGEVVRARAVAANVNPRLLFLDLIDPSILDDDFHHRIKRWKCGSATFRMNVALSELPRFTCLDGQDASDYLTAGIIIGPDLDYLDHAYRDARREGFSRRPVIEMLIPSTLDDSLAPAGAHVASLFCQHFAPELPEKASWDANRQIAADLILDTVNEYAPNFRASVLGTQMLSPLDLEREFGLTGGDIFHGALSLDQLFAARPMLGHADYRMPVPRLYLCGAGAHPGGGVTGAPGHNAAREIIKDLRRRTR